jgi:hypothetical protein
MSKRILSAVALLGAAGVISGCNIEQPSAGCIVQDGTFQARYILKNPADASKSCGKLQGEAIGVFKYVNPYPDQHPGVPASRVGIRPEGTAAQFGETEYTYTVTKADGTTEEKTVAVTRADPVQGTQCDSSGANCKSTAAYDATSMSATLADQPDAKGLCKASSFEPATVSLSEVSAEGQEIDPARTISYKFGDVFVYSHPSAPGTQLEGTMTYSDGLGCEAEYRVLALWPQVPCVPGSTKPAESCGVGSGLNPDFDAVCVADIGPMDDDGNVLGGCVFNSAKGVPSFK